MHKCKRLSFRGISHGALQQVHIRMKTDEMKIARERAPAIVSSIFLGLLTKR